MFLIQHSSLHCFQPGCRWYPSCRCFMDSDMSINCRQQGAVNDARFGLAALTYVPKFYCGMERLEGPEVGQSVPNGRPHASAKRSVRATSDRMTVCLQWMTRECGEPSETMLPTVFNRFALARLKRRRRRARDAVACFPFSWLMIEESVTRHSCLLLLFTNQESRPS